MELPLRDALCLGGLVLPSTCEELVTYAPQDVETWEIIGFQEINVAMAILSRNMALLTSTFCESDMELSMLDLAVRFGHAQFAAAFARLGISFKGLSKDDFAPTPRVSEDEDHSVGLFLPSVHAAIAAAQTKPSLTKFLWSEQLPLLPMLLVESRATAIYAAQLARLSKHVHPKRLVAFLSLMEEDTIKYLSILMDAGVDLCKLPAVPNRYDFELSVLDFALISGGDDDAVLRLISAGAKSAQGVNVGTFLVECIINDFYFNLEAAKALDSVGIDLWSLCVDFNMLERVRPGRFAGGQRGKRSILGVAIMLGEFDAAKYLSLKGCTAPDLTAMDFSRGLLSFHWGVFDEEREERIKAALKKDGTIGTQDERVYAAASAHNIVLYQCLWLPICQWARWWTRQVLADIPLVAVQHMGIINHICAFLWPVPLDLLRLFCRKTENVAISDHDDLQAAVIEPVVHADIAEVVDPLEAAAVAESVWASSVERRLEAGDPSSSDTGVDHSINRRVIVLKFSRHSKELDLAILESSLAQSVVAKGIDTQPSWARGAKVLADGIEPDAMEAHIDTWLPSHVVLYEDDLPSLQAALQHLSYQIRKRKPGGAGYLQIPDEPTDLSLMDVSSGSELDEVSQCTDTSKLNTTSETLQDIDEHHDIPQRTDTSKLNTITEPLQDLEYEVKYTFIHYVEQVETRTVRTV